MGMKQKPMGVAHIESLDQEGRGVAHVEGKAIFVDGALPGEIVRYESTRVKPSYEFAQTIQIIKSSNQRVIPQCAFFGRCGGCALQHLEPSAQVAAKQRLLENDLKHIGKVKAVNMMPPIHGPSWGYRHKARLRVRYVEKKARVLVGFNEKSTPYVADMQSCEVLPNKISSLIVPLQILIEKLTIREAIPQIEIAVGEGVVVLVFRIMAPLSDADSLLLEAFAESHGVQVWTQSKGLDTVRPLYPLDAPGLSYSLPEFDLRYPFNPTEFTQVNPFINRVMVRRAMQLLNPQSHERIADFFCGLGNFTLPIARSGAKVYGIEGLKALVDRANEGAHLNGLNHLASFEEANLFEMTPERLRELGHFDKWLVDPPRDGAMALMESIPESLTEGPNRIVYVSCNPATLARDAGILVHQKGYVLSFAGVINMFPHTAHIESMALFERPLIEKS
jgi:23S rRNA (uracil1939-C5)-methyltransferase